MSEPYIVSARKYRPQTFDTVVGQEHITTTLKNAIHNQQLAHAFLFCGPRGVGKTTCARILAKTINCENPTSDIEACGQCASCKSFADNTSFNVFELDAASNNSVDDIRELNAQVRFAPQQGKYKIYIIDEVHMLSSQAFNAFLKTLEEPPSYAIFILATTEKHKILPTILSRCQIFDFKRITNDDIVAHLQKIAAKEGIQAQEAALHIIAQKSEGCMRDALSLLDRIFGYTGKEITYEATMEHLNILDAAFYFSLTDSVLAKDISQLLLTLDDALNKGFEASTIMDGLSSHYRNMLLCKDPKMLRLMDVPKEHIPVYLEKSNQLPPSFLLTALNILNESALHYKDAANKRLHVEMCLIRLCYILQVTSAEKKNNEPKLEKNVQASIPSTLTDSRQSNIQSTPSQSEVKPQATASVTPTMSSTAPVAQIVKKDSETVSTTSKTRRISKSLIVDIDKELDNDVQLHKGPVQVLTDAQVKEVYEQYLSELAAQKKSVLHAQFSQMKAEKSGEDEVKIIVPSELSETYVKQQRDYLIDFFRKHTGLQIRVITELVTEPDLTQNTPAVLSKNEIYAAMVEKNPSLQKLTEALNLQIVY